MNQQMTTLQRQDEVLREQNGTSLAEMDQPMFAMTDSGLKPRSIEEAWRFAKCLAGSQFVPATYQGKPHDCLIAIDMAARLNVAPLMLLQNTYVVKGKPGMEAKLVISLVNASGLFTDPLEYEVEGDDPKAKNYRVRAFATRASTGKTIYGPWITWDIVSGEGWDKKDGSKWKTIPSLMFIYRAAAWFTRSHCPEVTMGMLTTDELHDVEDRRPVEATVLDGKPRSKFGFKGTQTEAGDTAPESQPQAEAEDGSDGKTPDTTPEADEPQTEPQTEPETEDEQDTVPESEPDVDEEEDADAALDRALNDADVVEPLDPDAYTYWCPACEEGFDFDRPTCTKKIKDTIVPCCPRCKSIVLDAWEDHVRQVQREVA